MKKFFSEPFNRKLVRLIFIFLICMISFMMTDYLVSQYFFHQITGVTFIDSEASALWNQRQMIGMGIKSGIGVLGIVFFLMISRQMFFLISGREMVKETLKEQNLKIIRKSIELSDVMRRFEDQNYDLELSKKELSIALESVREKEKDQRIIVESSPLGIIRFNSDGEIKDCNEKFIELMGSSRQQLIGFNSALYSTPKMRETIQKALKGEISFFEDVYTSITGGKTSYLRVAFNPVNPGMSSTEVIATVEDISQRVKAEQQLKRSHDELEALVMEKTSALIREIEERKSAHEALKKSEEKYRSILENIEDSYFELDLKGNLRFFNKSLIQFLGYTEEELMGMNYKQYTAKEDIKKLFSVFNEVYKTGRISQLIHCTLITKDHIRKNAGILSSLMKHKNGEIIGFQGLARDVTKQMLVESRLQHTQKMEAIGNLAGGVAHDFNNILGGIIGYTQLIKKHSSRESRIYPYVEQVLKASERATGLVRQILLFSRKTETRKIPMDMGLIAKEVIELLRASIPSTIEIRHHFKDDLNPISADQTQIHQVFMNLCSNAAYAMKAGGGCLEITLDQIMVAKEGENGLDDLSKGEYIRLSVSDTGHGMNKETLKKIFDPYFTTKEIGEGSGLGLATVHGIVKDHGGIIRVESEEGVGTAFHLYFPTIRQVIEENEKIIEIAKGNETVLFVDDEIYLADVGKEMLEDYGYRVESMTSSVKAWEAFSQAPDKFDLVITDYTMPGMTGDLLAGKIREIRPDIPIIMCTGISVDQEITKGLKLEKILIKPLNMDYLLQEVRNVLDHPLARKS
ncbi:MAG: PAS domain S-box protein [Desulfobacula sp.]